MFEFLKTWLAKYGCHGNVSIPRTLICRTNLLLNKFEEKLGQ